MLLSFQKVKFAYVGAESLLFEDVTAHFPEGWTGIAGPNGSGKTTILHLCSGDLQPLSGKIVRPRHIVFCPQRTDNPPENMPQFIGATEPEAHLLRVRLQIGADWATRWSTLSHGERKRAQIAVALWQLPDVLLIDEPTNHIDSDARELLVEALRSFHGVGLLVSHDRELLDLLCIQCLFLDPPRALMRPGNYTKASTEVTREETSLLFEKQVLHQNLERLSYELKRRHSEAARAEQRNSKRGLPRGDSDGRAKINGVRASGKDGQAGRLARQLKGRISQMQQRISAIKIKKHYAASFWMEGSISPRRRLFTVPADSIFLDGLRKLVVPEFSMLREDRVAVTGANGLGKSTFLRHVLRRLDLPPERIVYLPQEIDLAQTRIIMEDVHQLSHEQLGLVMTVVSALGSRPQRLLNNRDASPGELRKILLALGIIHRPYLIVMDEPTNHLDLPAIEHLENALCACPCALLLISHDFRFLSKVADKHWHFHQEGQTVRISMDAAFKRKL